MDLWENIILIYQSQIMAYTPKLSCPTNAFPSFLHLHLHRLSLQTTVTLSFFFSSCTINPPYFQALQICHPSLIIIYEMTIDIGSTSGTANAATEFLRCTFGPFRKKTVSLGRSEESQRHIPTFKFLMQPNKLPLC